MSQLQTSSVIRPLEIVRERVKQRLMQVPEYRAFLAMEKPIAEVANISDLVVHLQAAQQKLLERLATTKEYQALLTVEKAIRDLSQVLEIVADVEPAPSEKALANEETAETTSLPVPEHRQALDEIAIVTSIGNMPTMKADETAAVTAAPPVIHSQDVSEFASATEAVGEQGGKSIPNPTANLSTLGLVEEWRLTAMVRESFSENGSDEDAPLADEDGATAEKAKVA